MVEMADRRCKTEGASRPLRVLLVEDSRREAELLVQTLRAGGLEPNWERAFHRPQLLAALDSNEPWDVILCDYSLPGITATEALELLAERAPGVPVIVVTEVVGEEAAVECMRLGARDLVLKDRLQRLAPAITRELMQVRVQRERMLAQQALKVCQRFLRIANHRTELGILLREWVDAMVTAIPLSAVGIRLVRPDGGIDYRIHHGFEESFLQSESPLTLEDHHCVCSRVLRGEAAGLPMETTPHGSAWTPDLSELVAGVQPPGFRCGCGDAGFRSLAVVPIHTGDAPMGLIQLAHRRPEMLDGDLISLLEILAVQLGTALVRTQTLEQVERRERLHRTMVELSPDAIMVIDQTLAIVIANGRAARLFGYDHPRLLRGLELQQLLTTPKDAEPELPGLLEQAGSGVEVLGQRGDGTTFPGEVHTAAMASGTMVSVRDITERKELQAQLGQADRLASVGMLAAGVAHEINNPLTYLLQNLEWIIGELEELPPGPPPADGEPASDLAQVAREAMDGVSRVRKIMRDLRTFSQVEETPLVPVLVNDVLEVASNMARGEIAPRARLLKRLGEVPPVLAEEGRLAQVFLNLLINAAQAMDQGAAEDNEIEISSRLEGTEVLVEVRDSGAGIPPAELERLFTPFYSTKERGAGSGLGLAICQNLVRHFKGRIEVHSEVGQGATFTVHLPAIPRPPATDDLTRSTGRSAVRPQQHGRVLIVDDEPSILTSLRRLLRPHEVQTAEGGQEAMELLRRDRRFDVILCDVMMPGVTGKDLHDWLRRTDAKLAARMVFITGGACAGWAETFLQQVSNLVLDKPLDAAALMQLVDRMVAADDA